MEISRLSIDDVRLPEWGWHEDDAMTVEKLGNSLVRHGQLQPVLVREVGALHEVVDGRKRVALLRVLGHKHVAAVNLGHLSDHDAMRVALDLELRADTDFVRVATCVKQLADQDDAPETFAGRLAATAPWDAERIGYFVQLADWDWTIYTSAPDEQSGFAWGDMPAEPPPAAPAPSLAVEPAAPSPVEPAPDQTPREGYWDLVEYPPLPEPAVVELPDAVVVPAQVAEEIWEGDVPEIAVPDPVPPPLPVPVFKDFPADEPVPDVFQVKPKKEKAPKPAKPAKPNLQIGLFGDD